MNFDLIGDVHGHADELESLLQTLGYTADGPAWRPPAGTTAIFLGDLIDRGPRNGRVLEMVRAMIDRGWARAVMGNHELNAIGYHTEHPARPGVFLRPHTPEKTRQHEEFLREFADRPDAWADAIAFFLTLPVVLELADGPLRVVHACWSPRHLAAFRDHPLTRGDRLTREFLVAAYEKPSLENRILETLLKGPEVPVAQEHQFRDERGTLRQEARYRWWLDGRPDAPERLILPDDRPAATTPIAARDVPEIPSPDGVPVFFGHYWWNPRRDGSSVGRNWACLDLSVAHHGQLAAYRWREEDRGRPLSRERLVTVDRKGTA